MSEADVPWGLSSPFQPASSLQAETEVKAWVHQLQCPHLGMVLGGHPSEPVEKLKKSVDLPIVYSGGITTIDDIKKLNESGVEGVVIGSALYTNKIDLTEALKYQKRI